MRVLNLISATTLQKIEDDLMSPFDVMDLHHILDLQISQDAIIDQMNSDELSYALSTGNIRPLWEIAPDNPLLLRGFTSGWINKFMNEPFDPLCVMLAMRAKLMLDVIDELGHSYNLLRAIGYGFIDFGDIPGEEPGDPGDYYPPEIDNPIDFPEIPTPPGPEPGEPGYVPPGPGEPGYVPPVPGPGEPGYVPPMPGEPGYVPPGPGEPGYVPGPGEEGYTEPGTTPNTHTGGGPGGGAPWGSGRGPGDLGGSVTGGGRVTPESGDPCADMDDPLLTVSFSYTTQQMAVSETQGFAVTGNHPRWSYENYTWKVSGGGGMLEVSGEGSGDPIYGPEEDDYDPDAVLYAFEVIYTAPPENALCVKNPTIELWCGGALMASLAIAVAEYAGTVAAATTWKDLTCEYWEAGDWWNCYLYNHTVNCAGAPMTGYPCELQRTSLVDCAGCYASTTGIACLSGTASMNALVALGAVDRRSTAQKAAGCCPEDLL